MQNVCVLSGIHNSPLPGPRTAAGATNVVPVRSCCLCLALAGLLIPAFAGIKEDWAGLSGGKGGKLAYTKPAGSNQRGSGVYVMNLAGDNEHRIADIEFPESHYGLAGSIQWSPDGRRLAVQTIQGVYVLNEDGSQLKTMWTGTIRNPGGGAMSLITNGWSTDNEIVYSVGNKVVKATIDTDNSKILTRDVVSSAPAGCGYLSVGLSGNFVSYIDAEANRSSGGWHRPMVVNLGSGEAWKMVPDNSDGCQLRLKPDGRGTVMWCHGDHSKLLVNRFKNSNPIHTYKPLNDGIQEPNWSNDDGFFVHMGGMRQPVGAWIRKGYSDDNINLGGDVLLPDLYVGGEVQPVDNTPPSAPSNLSATADGKTKINLTWDEASDDETGIAGYTIYRNGEKVGTTDNTSYADDGLSEGTTYEYQVSAVNGEDMEGEKSNESSATTEADNDTSPPEPTSAIAQSATSVKVSFNEPVTKESAENTGNYAISGGITVGGASLQGDNTSVALTTSTLTEKTSYTVTVSGIVDRSPNANTGGGQAEFMLSGEIRISNLSVAGGKAYEIVEAIAEGDEQFIDRGFTWESLGDCAGMAYIRTANDDKNETGESFLSFDINLGGTVYVAYRHADDLPPWLSSWSRTGNQVCGDGCSDVYEKDFEAGTVTLGGNRPGGAGNMYTVFVDGGGATISLPDRHPSGERAARIGAHFRGDLLRVTGLCPHGEYGITLTDAGGRVTRRRTRTGSRETVELCTIRPVRGVYLVNIRFGRQRYTVRAVAP